MAITKTNSDSPSAALSFSSPTAAAAAPRPMMAKMGKTICSVSNMIASLPEPAVPWKGIVFADPRGSNRLWSLGKRKGLGFRKEGKPATGPDIVLMTTKRPDERSVTPLAEWRMNFARPSAVVEAMARAFLAETPLTDDQRAVWSTRSARRRPPARPLPTMCRTAAVRVKAP